MKQEEYSTRVTTLQTELKPNETRYIPSGATPPSSIALLGVFSLLIIALCYAVALPICLLLYDIAGEGTAARNAVDRWNEGRWIAFGIIIVNLTVFLVIAYVTIFSFKFAAYITKLRNPKIGQRCAFFFVSAVCWLLYLPLFNGRSLARTDITILIIPVSWVLGFAGLLLVPYLVGLATLGAIYEMEFCEKAGFFLKRVARATLTWEQGKSLIQVLRDGHHDLIAGFVNSETQKTQNPGVTFSLFGHPQAQVAYMDVEVNFSAVIGSATNPTTSTWWVCHEKLTQEEAKSIATSIPTSVRKMTL